MRVSKTEKQAAASLHWWEVLNSSQGGPGQGTLPHTGSQASEENEDVVFLTKLQKS